METQGQAAAAPQQTAGAPSQLQGVVLNALTRQPIARALVTLAGASTLTDNDGRFGFTVPAAITGAILEARRPGFTGSAHDQSARREVMLTSRSKEVTLALTPLSAITGELVTPGDDAPGFLQVQLLHQRIEGGHAQWSIFRSTQVNSEGHFRFGNLPAGNYLVHVGVSLDPATSQLDRVRSGYVPLFYPAARDLAEATQIPLAAGHQVDIKIPLAREPFFPVAIPVAGEAERGFGFDVSSDSFLGLPGRFSPQDHVVHIELPSGHFRLEGRSFGPNPSVGVREFDVNAAPLRGTAITLVPTHPVPVTVHSQFTRNQNVVTVKDSVLTAAMQVGVALQRVGAAAQNRGNQGLSDEPDSKTTGISYLHGVAPGRYWANARPFNGYIASMTSGGVDLLVDPLVVAADGSAAPIELTLRDDTAAFTATLGSSLLQTAEQGDAGPLYLHLVPQSGTGVERDEPFPVDGAVNLSSVAPGAYLVFASSTQEPVEYRDPKVLAALAARCQSVTLEPGGTGRLTLDGTVSTADETGASLH